MSTEGEPPVTVTRDRHRGIDMIHLPEVAYYDTQAGAVDLGLDREAVVALRDALDAWLMRQEYPATGCNTSMACAMRDGCRRCRPERFPPPAPTPQD